MLCKVSLLKREVQNKHEHAISHKACVFTEGYRDGGRVHAAIAKRFCVFSL